MKVDAFRLLPPRYACIVAAALAVCPQGDGAAAPSEPVDDARCFVAAFATGQGDTSAQSAVAYYYLGRLDAQASDADIRQLVVRLARETPVQELRSESQRCGRRIAARGQFVAAIGKELGDGN